MEKAVSLIDQTTLSDRTKDILKETLSLMLESNSKESCTNFRFELQGIINALAAETLISKNQHSCLGSAFGDIAKRLYKSFYFTTKALEKAMS